MQVTYVGRASGGVFVSPDGVNEIPVGHGDTIDVPDDVGRSLLTQTGQWEQPEPPKPAKAADKKEAN